MDGVTVYPNVTLGEDCDLQPPCIIGKPPRGAADGERPLIIGPGAVIRPFTTIYAGSAFGARLQTGQCVSIREDNIFGDDVSIGTVVRMECGNRVGSRVRIHSGSTMEYTIIEDDVFIGPNTVFAGDPHPMNCPRYNECRGGAVIRRLARIGAMCMIMPGVEVGEDSLVGAASLVVRDVPPRMVVAGHPAKVVKAVADLACPPGWFERPYTWPPYCAPEPFDSGESRNEVLPRNDPPTLD
jgi:acetyltransferase-like isoleucine patch superfamily enzyme